MVFMVSADAARALIAGSHMNKGGNSPLLHTLRQ